LIWAAQTFHFHGMIIKHQAANSKFIVFAAIGFTGQEGEDGSLKIWQDRIGSCNQPR